MMSRMSSSVPRAGEAQASAVTSRVRTAAWFLLVLLGLIETVYGRHAMQDDGISYLDMGDAIARADWKMALNGVWSPLYPFLQGVTLRLLKPSEYLQFTVVHCVNFLIFLFALGCFDFLLRAAVTEPPLLGGVADDKSWLPKWAVFAVGYSVFLWSSLSLITLQLVGPDLLMAGFLYLAVGLLVQLRSRPESFFRFALLGAMLGFGYLAKAPVAPLAVVFFAASWFFAGGWRKAAPRVFLAVFVFLVIAAVWFVPLSRAKGHFTFGESARFNYVRHVNGASPRVYLQSPGTASGHFIHPVRKIFDTPPIYEFATPLKGTLPVWYDPSYWAAGVVPKISLRRELSVILHWLTFYLDSFFASQTALFVGFVVLCFIAGRSLFLSQMAARWPVWLIGLAGLGMYALIHTELRYVAVFFTLFWVGLYSGLNMPPGPLGRRLVGLVVVAVVIAIATPTVLASVGHLGQALKRQPHNHWQVAEDLRALGVKPGDQVARFPAHYGLAWARLLKVTVVAQVPVENSMDYWYAKPEVQSQVIETLRRLGVRAIVAEQVPSDDAHAPGPEWHKLGDGRYYALMLDPDSPK